MSVLLRAVAARCDLLGLELVPLAWLGLDVVVLLALAGGVVARCERADGETRWGAARTLLASGLVLLSTVVLSATVLGAARRLGPATQLAVHALALGLFVGAERSRGRRIGAREVGRWALRPLGALLAPLRGLASAGAWRRARRAESLVLVALLVVLLLDLVLALFTLPLNYDSNTYRLSRVALWLQEGHIYHFAVDESRLDWVGQNTELVMLWLTGFFRREYPLVQLAQYGGGLLACLAVFELGGWLGMARLWRLGAALVLVGIPTVGTQLISSQNDLFTAGCLAAGLAFLPPALRGRRRAEWCLVGAGFGLALGAKATILFWGPGLVLLLAGWAWIERCPLRALVRGGALAAAVALPLCGFNFLLNSFDHDSPVAPKRALRLQATTYRAAPVAKTAEMLVALTWQLFEPHSNPLVPAPIRESAFDGLLELLAARSPYHLELRDALPGQGGWRARRLNEDEASFGAIVALAAALGGLLALAAVLRGDARDRGRVGTLAVALAAFFVAFAWLTGVSTNNYRYFCVQAPFLALVATDLFSRRRSRTGRALGGLFLLAQFVTALYVGAESSNQGLRVLRDPALARWYGHWREARQVAEALGETPLDVGSALGNNEWQAPMFRSGVAHRWRLLATGELRDRPGLAELLARRRLDALVFDPWTVPAGASADVSIRGLRSALGLHRALGRPRTDAERSGSQVVAARGIYSDRWTGLEARFRTADWRVGRFEIALRNPTPLPREVEMRSSRQQVSLRLEPGERTRLAVDAAEHDEISLAVRPPFVPAAHGVNRDERPLGLRLAPVDRVEAEGVFRDRWTTPGALFRLGDWQRGRFELALANPTPLPRTVRARSSLQEASWQMPPRSTRTVVLAVEPQDRVELEVSPPFVPRRWGLGEDERELGVLLAREPGPPGGD